MRVLGWGGIVGGWMGEAAWKECPEKWDEIWGGSSEHRRCRVHGCGSVKSNVTVAKRPKRKETRREHSMDCVPVLSGVFSLFLLPASPFPSHCWCGEQDQKGRRPPLIFSKFPFFSLVYKRPWTLWPQAKSLNLCDSQSPYPKLESY